MVHELTITVDDAVYQTLKPMVEQKTIGGFLHDFLQPRISSPNGQAKPSIMALRGTLHRIDTSDLREEISRVI